MGRCPWSRRAACLTACSPWRWRRICSRDRRELHTYGENVSFLILVAVELTSDRCWLLLSRPPALFFDHSRTARSPRKRDIAQSPEFSSSHEAENSLPWWCRGCLGSCCLCGRGRNTGDHSLNVAACTAAGSHRPSSTPPGGRSVCSGASRRATLCYKPGRRRCPAGGTGCCCVSAKQMGFYQWQRFQRRQASVGAGRATSCFPMHHFSVRKVQGGHFSSLWQL